MERGYPASQRYLGHRYVLPTALCTLIRNPADIGLASQNVASSPAIPSVKLRFLSTVDTARIPLYLAAGPSLDVWTTSEATEAWFESIFFSWPNITTDAPDIVTTRKWWTLARSQTPVGILAQVQKGEEDNSTSHVTEILFYGTIAADSPNGTPASSGSTNLAIDQLPELRVHALPLSSRLLRSRDVNPSNTAEAHFLRPLHDSLSMPLSPKRKRDIFEEATIANRKVRGKGGQVIAALAARGNESQQSYNPRRSLSIDLKGVSISDSRSLSANRPLSRPVSRRLSRSSSLSSDTRPQSRKEQLDTHCKRSTLSQVAVVPTQDEEPTTESRNKEALSKVVMAAMRMHGLQQKKKSRSSGTSSVPSVDESRQLDVDTAAEEVAKDDEYKLLYHQTYKGAALALVSGNMLLL